MLQLKPETRRNTFNRLGLTASCLLALRALGKEDSVWARTRSRYSKLETLTRG